MALLHCAHDLLGRRPFSWSQPYIFLSLPIMFA
jgi:hypothetical protein